MLYFFGGRNNRQKKSYFVLVLVLVLEKFEGSPPLERCPRKYLNRR